MSETREQLQLRFKIKQAEPFTRDEIEELETKWVEGFGTGNRLTTQAEIRLLAEAQRAQELQRSVNQLERRLFEYEQRDRLTNIQRYLVDDIEYLIRRARDADNAERRLEEVRSAAMEGDV